MSLDDEFGPDAVTQKAKAESLVGKTVTTYINGVVTKATVSRAYYHDTFKLWVAEIKGTDELGPFQMGILDLSSLTVVDESSP